MQLNWKKRAGNKTGSSEVDSTCVETSSTVFFLNVREKRLNSVQNTRLVMREHQRNVVKTLQLFVNSEVSSCTQTSHWLSCKPQNSLGLNGRDMEHFSSLTHAFYQCSFDSTRWMCHRRVRRSAMPRGVSNQYTTRGCGVLSKYICHYQNLWDQMLSLLEGKQLMWIHSLKGKRREQ